MVPVALGMMIMVTLELKENSKALINMEKAKILTILWVLLVALVPQQMAKFVMFRDYTNTKGNTKFKPVCLMKINICTQVMQERRVESQSIGGVLSEFYLNVKLSVQLLTIT